MRIDPGLSKQIIIVFSGGCHFIPGPDCFTTKEGDRLSSGELRPYHMPPKPATNVRNYSNADCEAKCPSRQSHEFERFHVVQQRMTCRSTWLTGARRAESTVCCRLPAGVPTAPRCIRKSQVSVTKDSKLRSQHPLHIKELRSMEGGWLRSSSSLGQTNCAFREEESPLTQLFSIPNRSFKFQPSQL